MAKVVAGRVTGRFTILKRPRGWAVEDLFTGTILLITSDRKEAERAAAELEERNPLVIPDSTPPENE